MIFLESGIMLILFVLCDQLDGVLFVEFVFLFEYFKCSKNK